MILNPKKIVRLKNLKTLLNDGWELVDLPLDEANKTHLTCLRKGKEVISLTSFSVLGTEVPETLCPADGAVAEVVSEISLIETHRIRDIDGNSLGAMTFFQDGTGMMDRFNGRPASHLSKETVQELGKTFAMLTTENVI